MLLLFVKGEENGQNKKANNDQSNSILHAWIVQNTSYHIILIKHFESPTSSRQSPTFLPYQWHLHLERQASSRLQQICIRVTDSPCECDRTVNALLHGHPSSKFGVCPSFTIKFMYKCYCTTACVTETLTKFFPQ